MKTFSRPLLSSLVLPLAMFAADPEKNSANTVILDAVGVQNLRLETAIAEPGDFEETIFALGRIESKPGNIAVVSSRISGRVVSLTAQLGESVQADAEIVKVESRQPGNPPPVIGLKAPLSGVITQTNVRLGEPVEPDRALLEITDLGEVFAVARVPEDAAGKLKPGATAHIRIAAVPDAVIEGRLLRFGTAADHTSGTIDAIFVVPNQDALIRPGMRAEFSIVVARRSDVTAVPRSAVQGSPSNRFVYVRDFDLPHAFIKTPVVTGQSNDRYTEIISGLFPADEVVTRGAYSLAFAGAGSLSLKEALDAAHGHSHAADGTELPSGGSSAQSSAAHSHDGSDHDHDNHEHGLPAWPWMISTAVLAIALLFTALRKRPRRT